jgi:hypothetical protein
MLVFPSRSQQAFIETEKRTFNLSNSESTSLHAFERKCVFDAHVGRLIEPLRADCGFHGREQKHCFLLSPLVVKKALIWCMPQKRDLAHHNLCKSRFLVSVETRPRTISA